jgi:hypothetical protein
VSGELASSAAPSERSPTASGSGASEGNSSACNSARSSQHPRPCTRARVLSSTNDSERWVSYRGNRGSRACSLRHVDVAGSPPFNLRADPPSRPSQLCLLRGGDRAQVGALRMAARESLGARRHIRLGKLYSLLPQRERLRPRATVCRWAHGPSQASAQKSCTAPHRTLPRLWSCSLWSSADCMLIAYRTRSVWFATGCATGPPSSTEHSTGASNEMPLRSPLARGQR